MNFFSICRDTTGACWGSKTRFLEIQRKDGRWLFHFFTTIDVKIPNKPAFSVRRTVERLYCSTTRCPKNRLSENGTTSKSGQLNLFLCPEDNSQHKKYIDVTVSSRSTDPEILKHSTLAELPFTDPAKICPNTIEFGIFKTDNFTDKVDSNKFTTRNCLERIYCHMYPGGAGLKVGKL